MPNQQKTEAEAFVEECRQTLRQDQPYADLLAERDELQQQRDDLQARVSGLEGQLALAEQGKLELLAALENVLFVARGAADENNRCSICRIAQAAIAAAEGPVASATVPPNKLGGRAE